MADPEGKQTSGKSSSKSIDPEVFRLNASVCQAMANEKRIEIIYHLRDGAKSATELRGRTGLSKSSLSQHMSILVERGLVRSTPHGKFVEYELSGKEVDELYLAVTNFCREFVELRRKLARQL